MKEEYKKKVHFAEFMHIELMNLFHELRKKQNNDVKICIDGIQFNSIIAAAKARVYKEYGYEFEKYDGE